MVSISHMLIASIRVPVIIEWGTALKHNDKPNEGARRSLPAFLQPDACLN